MSPIRAVFYDAGYTLLEPTRTIPELISDVLREQGHPAEAEAVARSVPSFWSHVAGLEQDGELVFGSETKVARLWHSYYETIVAAVAEAAGFALSDDDVRMIAIDVTDRYKTPALWRAYPDATAALIEGKRRGLVQGIISDWGVSLTPIIHGLGLSRYLDFVVVSAVMGAAKPNGYLFDLAVQRGGVPRDSIVYVGDTYATDVIGGRGAGILTVLLDRAGMAGGVDVPVIRDLTELFASLPPD